MSLHQVIISSILNGKGENHYCDPLHPFFSSLSQTECVSVLSPPLDKMWHSTKNLTFKVPMGFRMVVSPISHYLSSPFLSTSTTSEGGGWGWSRGERDGPNGLGPCHCSCLSVHEGTTLIDSPHSFPVKQMA